MKAVWNTSIQSGRTIHTRWGDVNPNNQLIELKDRDSATLQFLREQMRFKANLQGKRILPITEKDAYQP